MFSCFERWPRGGKRFVPFLLISFFAWEITKICDEWVPANPTWKGSLARKRKALASTYPCLSINRKIFCTIRSICRQSPILYAVLMTNISASKLLAFKQSDRMAAEWDSGWESIGNASHIWTQSRRVCQPVKRAVSLEALSVSFKSQAQVGQVARKSRERWCPSQIRISHAE